MQRWYHGYAPDAHDAHDAQDTVEFSHIDYTAGWICAIPVELAAATAMLEEIHPRLPIPLGDDNTYTLGRIGGHNVTIACMSAGIYGTTSATIVATHMRSTFKSLRFTLMVGVGGGVWSPRADVRLGDIVVSLPNEQNGGVVQSDYGKRTHDGGFQHKGMLDKPPPVLLTAVARLQADHKLKPSLVPQFLRKMKNKYPESMAEFEYPGEHQDQLFDGQYPHRGGEITCHRCDTEKLIKRPRRTKEGPAIHYGTIASSNQVIKDSATRDMLSKDFGVLCFEMEAAGLMDHFSCLVVRGICDYADSHKNKQWQGYAAAAAAAYAKELLRVVLPVKPPGSDLDINQKSVSNDEKRQRTRKLEERIEELLVSLKFNQMDTRHINIEDALASTCSWLLEKAEYRAWLNSNSPNDHLGFMWIKGKAGAGKSTLMKFALANVRKTIRNDVLIWFFFNARGDELERTTLGLYRSLTFQLVRQIPNMQRVFDSLDNSLLHTEFSEWTLGPLKMLFHTAVQVLQESTLFCFVDALDECAEVQIREMIEVFRRVGDRATSCGVHFKVLFASRYYPHITVPKALNLKLDEEFGHGNDISHFIKKSLHIGDTGISKTIMAEIQRKASGIFLWVVLVVGILNKEHDEGRSPRRLRQKLDEIPADLHKLFYDILTRDTRNREELLTCIQWLLFAARPLQPRELYYAIHYGVDPEGVSYWNSDKPTDETIGKFILNASKGLAETTNSSNPTVQFIHESVRDFLLQEKTLDRIWPDIPQNFQGVGHDKLKNYCLDYLSTEGVRTISINPSSPQFSQRSEYYNKLPLLEYAMRQAYGSGRRD